MEQLTFDTYVHRATSLLDWQSLFGGLSAALSALSGVPRGAGATKKRVRLSRADLLAVCEGNEDCINDLLGCFKKPCKSVQNSFDCCENESLCDFRDRMRALS